MRGVGGAQCEYDQGRPPRHGRGIVEEVADDGRSYVNCEYFVCQRRQPQYENRPTHLPESGAHTYAQRLSRRLCMIQPDGEDSVGSGARLRVLRRRGHSGGHMAMVAAEAESASNAAGEEERGGEEADRNDDDTEVDCCICAEWLQCRLVEGGGHGGCHICRCRVWGVGLPGAKHRLV